MSLIELLGQEIDLGLLESECLKYSRPSAGFGMLVFFKNVSLLEFHVTYLALFCPFSVKEGFEWFWVLNGRSLQEYPVNIGFHQGSILSPTLLLIYTNDLPSDVICNTAIYADNITLYCKCDQASYPWQKLELASELRIGGLSKETSSWFQCWKNLTCFVWPVQQHWCYWCENGWKWMWKSSNMLRLFFSSKLDWSFYTISVAKTVSKLDRWFVLWCFFLVRLIWISTNLLYGIASNTVVMSGWCS